MQPEWKDVAYPHNLEIMVEVNGLRNCWLAVAVVQSSGVTSRVSAQGRLTVSNPDAF